MTQRKLVATIVPVALATLVGITTQAFGAGYGAYHDYYWKHYYTEHFNAELNGYNEVPSVSTPATGHFKATLEKDSDVINFKLSYENLTGNACQAHIHFGERHTSGGVSAWLCGERQDQEGAMCPALANLVPPDGIEPCPAEGGTVEGTISVADVVGPAVQGIREGELDELIAAMKAGATYVNVHTSEFQGGEIRGQIERESKGRHYPNR